MLLIDTLALLPVTFPPGYYATNADSNHQPAVVPQVG
jgi:hypothetical protein